MTKAKSKKAGATPKVVSPSKKKKTQSKPQAAPQKPKTTVVQPSLPKPKEASKPVITPSSSQNPQPPGIFDRQLLLNLRKQISLLFMLTDRPLSPALNERYAKSVIENAAPSRRVLSFDSELALVEAFTFISTVSVDPSKVSALCLEEVWSKDKTTFILKVSANHGDGLQLRSGLNTIVADLVTASSDTQNTPTNADRVLRSVVTLNLQKLLCRIRSRHAVWAKSNYSKDKRAKPLLLPQVIQLFRDELQSHNHLACLQDRIDRLETFSRSLEGLGQLQSNNTKNEAVCLLMQIIKTVHSLWSDTNFQQLFQNGQHDFVHLALAKLARYLSASNFLIEKFRTVRSLTSMKVEVIKLDPILLPTYQSVSQGLRTFVSTLAPAKDVDLLTAQASRSCRSSSEAELPKNCDDAFASVINTKCPVHAEIQLLFHYEFNPTLVTPRLILSTKKPCFLCSVFFKIHGGFHTASSHGRLYEKWALPQMLDRLNEERKSAIRGTTQEFTEILTQCIRDAALPTNRAKIASLESLFRGSAIWAMAKSLSPAASTPGLVPQTRSKTPLSKVVVAGSIRSTSSHETIKPPKGLSEARGSQDTIRAFRGDHNNNKTNDIENNTQTAHHNLVVMASDTQRNLTPSTPPSTSSKVPQHPPETTAPLSTPNPSKRLPPSISSPSHHHHDHHPPKIHLPQGSSITLILKASESAATVHTTKLHLHLTTAAAADQTYNTTITNFDQGQIQSQSQTHSEVSIVDISTLPAGVDVDIDLSSTDGGGGRRGLILRSGSEDVLLRWG